MGRYGESHRGDTSGLGKGCSVVRFSVALVERDGGGRVNSASHWWRYDGRHDGYLGGRRWFGSFDEAVDAMRSEGLDLSRWAVWSFSDHRFPEPVGRCSVAELVGEVTK